MPWPPRGERPSKHPTTAAAWPRPWCGWRSRPSRGWPAPACTCGGPAGCALLACTPELAEYAERLGRVADAIAGENPLPPPLRVFQRLYEVAQPEFPPECAAPNNERIIRLAAAASDRAAVSSRQELYPRDMDARRALHLGLGALTGLEVSDLDRKGERFDPPGIRARIAARYPEAEPLPDRPELDELLREAGLDVTWDATTTTYRRPDESPLATSGSSRLLTDRVRLVARVEAPAQGGDPRGGRAPPVRRAAAVRAARRRVPRPDRPAQGDDRLRAGAAAAVPGAGAGLVRPTAAEAPAGQGRRAGGRLAGGPRGRRRPAGLARTARTCSTWSRR